MKSNYLTKILDFKCKCFYENGNYTYIFKDAHKRVSIKTTMFLTANGIIDLVEKVAHTAFNSARFAMGHSTITLDSEGHQIKVKFYE